MRADYVTGEILNNYTELELEVYKIIINNGFINEHIENYKQLPDLQILIKDMYLIKNRKTLQLTFSYFSETHKQRVESVGYEIPLKYIRQALRIFKLRRINK